MCVQGNQSVLRSEIESVSLDLVPARAEARNAAVSSFCTELGRAGRCCVGEPAEGVQVEGTQLRHRLQSYREGMD